MSIFIIAFLVLLIAWVLGWIVFHVASLWIHILLVAAMVSLLLHFLRGRHGEADLRIKR
ncbi:MAG: DUF5670 family protein [Terriglobales bacterium]